MTTAKITRCKHYFHGVCLRKWLYVQDRCPLCHEIIMHQETKAEPENTVTRVPNQVNIKFVLNIVVPEKLHLWVIHK